MKNKILLLLLTFLLAFLTACSIAGSTPEAEASDEMPPVAVVNAREALAEELGIPVAEIPFGEYERAEWTDSCLGLGGPAESCLAVMYPGWQAMFDVDGMTYEVRTDEQGEIIRIK